MARTIMVERDGTVSSFAFKKVDRSKLYGRKRRLPLDPDGETCTRAALTDDGSLILLQGMVAQGYFDDGGCWIPHGDLVGVDAEGEVVPERPSTLGRPVPLEGPFEPRVLLDVRVQSVYALEAGEIDDALVADLSAGRIFRLPFSYRSDYKQDDAFLVAGMDDGLYALVGQSVEPEWCSPQELPVIEDADDDLDDELDFEMF